MAGGLEGEADAGDDKRNGDGHLSGLTSGAVRSVRGWLCTHGRRLCYLAVSARTTSWTWLEGDGYASSTHRPLSAVVLSLQ